MTGGVSGKSGVGSVIIEKEFNPVMKQRLSFCKNRYLSIRLLLYVTAFSLLFSFVISAYQLYLDYQKDIRAIENDITFVQESYLPAITSNAYNLNESQLLMQLQGALQLRNIEYIEIIGEDGDASSRIAVGNPHTMNDITKSFELMYNSTVHDTIPVGTLTIKATTLHAHQRLKEKAVILVICNTVGVLLLLFIIFIIFQLTLARHLTSLATYTQALNIDNLDTALDIKRRQSNFLRPDELDQMADAINDLRIRLREGISEREKAEAALRESGEMYRNLFEMESDALLLVRSNDGQILEANASFLSLYGYSKEELLNLNAGALLLDIEPQNQGNDKNEETPTIYQRKKSGAVFPVEIVSSRFLWQAAGVQLYAIRDITFRINAEKEKEKLASQLRHSQKMEAIGTLAGGIAHEFNNVIGIILGNAELSLAEVPTKTPVHDFMEEIVEASLRAKTMVRQLLNFSQKEKIEAIPISLPRLVQEAMDTLRPSIPPEIKIQCDIPGDIRHVTGSSKQIHQILYHLCTNAFYAMGENGGLLTIKLQNFKLTDGNKQKNIDLCKGPYVKLIISDTGMGMEPGLIEKIFDPYFTTKAFGVGTGMGLAIVHGIVLTHKGAIMVDSAPGKGSSFAIFLPAYKTTDELSIS